MKRVFEKIDRLCAVIERIGVWGGNLSGAILISSAAMILYAVIMRRVIGQAPSWSIELGGYSLVLVTYFAISQAVARGEIPRMLLVYGRLRPRTQTILDIITYTLTLIFLVLLMWKGVELIHSTYSTGWKSVVLRLPRWWPLTCVYIGILLLSLQITIHIYRSLRSLVSADGK
ncbi:TRAP transporter small permease [Thermodesulfobacteriota bacterium]